MDKLTINQIKFIDKVMEEIGKGVDFSTLFDLIYKKLKKFIPYNRIGIGVVDPISKDIVSIANRTDGEVKLDIGYSLSPEKTTLNSVLKNGEIRVLNNLKKYLEKRPHSESTKLILEEGILSSLTLPLYIDNKISGVIFFSSKKIDQYSEKHINFLSKIATQLAISIDRSRLITQLKNQNRELEEGNRLKNEFLTQLKIEVKKQTKELKKRNEQYEILLKIAKGGDQLYSEKQFLNHLFLTLKEFLKIDNLGWVRPSFRKGKLKMFIDKKGVVDEKYFDIFDTSFNGKCKKKLKNGEIVSANMFDKGLEDIKYLFLDRKYQYFEYIPTIFKTDPLSILVLCRENYKVFDKNEQNFIKEMIDTISVAIKNIYHVNKIRYNNQQLIKKGEYLSEEIEMNFGEIVGNSKKLKTVLDNIKKVAPTNSTVLIRGETGVGKELIARAIHQQSLRKRQIFVKVNCAALNENLITSEFFGHEKGSFTGALDRKIGKFELANGGTIFLDEIGELTPEIQVKLLRVLQEREFERVGGNKTIRVDVRVVAATNRDLIEDIESGKFRADLYYRLNVFPLEIPPLRERLGDILPLTNHFMNKYSEIMGKKVDKIDLKTKEFLIKYDFPGNIRELENMVERGVITSEEGVLDIDMVKTEDVKVRKIKKNYIDLTKTLEEVIVEHLKVVMEKTKWKVYGDDGAAKILGLKPTTLQSKLKKFGLK